MSSSQQAGIEGYISTHQLSSCSLTWNAEKKTWLVIVTRDDHLQWRRGPSLRGALVAAVEGLGKGADPERSGVLE
jgi:hypothetical protein